MKLIIYWLTIMVIMPLFYLWWWKKQRRLILGIIIFVILVVSWFLPGKIAFSILERELKNVEKKTEEEGWAERGKDKERRSWQKLEEALKNTLQQEVTSENREKIAVEKEIIKWREEYEKSNKEKDKIKEEKYREGREYWEILKNPCLLRMWEKKMEKIDKKERGLYQRIAKGWKMSQEKEWEWARKWGGKEVPPIFLFCGEEFNYELVKERKTFKGSWQIVKDRNYHSDVIDFGKCGSAKPDFLKKRIREIWEQWNSGITRYGAFTGDYPTILLKNINKITSPKLSNELLLILDPEKNTTYDKYQIKDWNGNSTGEEGNVDLSKFVLIVTTSTTGSHLSLDLRTKLKHIEPFLDKYFWTIFFFSIGAEVIIFLLIKRKKTPKKIFWNQITYDNIGHWN